VQPLLSCLAPLALLWPTTGLQPCWSSWQRACGLTMQVGVAWGSGD